MPTRGTPKDRALTLEEIHAAYHAALRQAETLFDEGRFLLEHKRHASALHRLVICLEELGKARILFYQGALTESGAEPHWAAFWRSYFSHTQKLEQALLVSDELPLNAPESAQEVEEVLLLIRRRAIELDARKQESSYSGPSGETFGAPTHEAYEAHATNVLTIAENVIAFIRGHKATKARLEDFREVLRYPVKLARSLGYTGCSSREEFHARVAETNGAMIQLAETVPSDDAFMARVAERYEIIPPRLTVTLPQLRRSSDFRRFYQNLGEHLSYPDWIILGVVFNIALNARVDVDRYVEEGRLAELGEWSEQVDTDKPLGIEIFTDFDHFERMLDVWLVSFLTGLGLIPELKDGQLGRARRVAARWFGIFGRDVPHPEIFGGDGA